MNETQRRLIYLIRCAIRNENNPIIINENELKQIIDLAKSQDMKHFVGWAVQKNGVKMNNDDLKDYRNEYYKAIRRTSIQDTEIQKLDALFEELGVDFILLKGSLIRNYYPEKWMRQSSDIDVLVKEEDINIVTESLVNSLGYRKGKREAHDIPLRSLTGQLLELHFVLSMREWKAKPILDNVWNSCVLLPNKCHEYHMNDEFYYFYHMFHTAKHFHLGGCGVRAIIDTWVLNHAVGFVAEKRTQLLEEGGLLKFARTIEKISEKWFSDSSVELPKEESEVEDYILSGGVFGASQRVAAKQADKGTRLKFVLSRLFPSADSSIKYSYPILQKTKILLPFCWLHRLAKTVLTGKMKKANYELKESKSKKEESREIEKMFQWLGLE